MGNEPLRPANFGQSITCASLSLSLSAMHLMYTLDESGNRVYTLKVRSLGYI